VSVFFMKCTYTLVPSPVTRHEVAVPPFPIHEITVWNVVNSIDQLRVFEDVVNNLPWIAVPELELGSHPLRCWCIFWAETTILGSVRFPWYATKFDRIDC
jgi:hypothetical protein